MHYCNSMSIDLTGSKGRWIKAEAEVNDMDLAGWAAEIELDLVYATTFQRFILMRCLVERMLLTDLRARDAVPVEQVTAELEKNAALQNKVIEAIRAKVPVPAAATA
jgi:hypothetical protein